MSIQVQQATVYYSPAAGRRYFTKAAAIRAEASAIIRRKYPTEDEERDDQGRITYPGFHWSLMERADELHERLCQRIKSALQREAV